MSKEGLEALKEHKLVLKQLGHNYCDNWGNLIVIEKELKALEVIKKNPQATLWLIQHCDKEMEYEDMISIFKEDITKEQFELLKEVLL